MARRHDIRQVVVRFCSQYFRPPATEKPSHWPCPVAGWQALLRRHFRHEGGVKLQLAIDYQLRRALTDDFCRLLDVGNAGVTGAAVTGKRQHRHARLFSGDGLPGFGAGKGDIRQLCRRRLWHHAAIGKPNAGPLYCGSIRKMDESVLQPSCKPIMRNPARSTFAVEERLPAIQTSALPALTIAAANISGSVSFSSASGGVFRPRGPASDEQILPALRGCHADQSPVARPSPRRD